MKRHFYHQLSTFILNSEAHLQYNANGLVNHFTRHTQVLGKIHLCPVQNMKKSLYALPSQMRVQQIKVSRETMFLGEIIVQVPQSETFVQYKRLVMTYREKGCYLECKS